MTGDGLGAALSPTALARGEAPPLLESARHGASLARSRWLPVDGAAAEITLTAENRCSGPNLRRHDLGSW